MARLQQFKSEVNQVIVKSIKDNMPEPNMLHASFCNDFPNEEYRWAWSDFMIPSGSLSLNNWIKNSGLIKTTKKDATCVLLIGIKNDCDLWVSVKRIWLKN